MNRTDVKVTSANSRIEGTPYSNSDQELLRDDGLRDPPRFLDPPRLRGTFAPFLRASDRPMAIACLRLFTFPPCPDLPRFSVPCLRRRIALSTLLLAPRPYFRRRFFAAMDDPSQ